MDDWCNTKLRLLDPSLFSSGKIQSLYYNRLNKMLNFYKGDDIFKRITEGRKDIDKDYYIVIGQLNSTENEPIDSWSFFKFLKSINAKAVYVCWKKHKMYG